MIGRRIYWLADLLMGRQTDLLACRLADLPIDGAACWLACQMTGCLTAYITHVTIFRDELHNTPDYFQG